MKKIILIIIFIAITIFGIDSFTSVDIKQTVASYFLKLKTGFDLDDVNLDTKNSKISNNDGNLDAKNSKISSDIRIIYNKINDLSEENFIQATDILGEIQVIDKNSILGNISIGTPNYDILGIEKEKYLDVWGKEYSIAYANIDGKNYIQILAFKRDMNGEPIEVLIRGDILPSDIINIPLSLFKKSNSDEHYDNGEYLGTLKVDKEKINNRESATQKCSNVNMLSSSIEIGMVKGTIKSEDDLIIKVVKDYSNGDLVWVVGELNYKAIDLDNTQCGTAIVAYYKNGSEMTYYQVSKDGVIKGNYIALDNSYPKSILSK